MEVKAVPVFDTAVRHGRSLPLSLRNKLHFRQLGDNHPSALQPLRGGGMKTRRWRLPFVLATTAAALALGIGAAADVGSGSGPPTSIGSGGAAASVEPIATQAGIHTLTKGGNALDAPHAAGGMLR